MYNRNDDFEYSAFDQRNPAPGPGFMEQMDVAPPPYQQPPNSNKMNMQPGMVPPGYYQQPMSGYGGMRPEQYVFDPTVTNFAMQYGSKLVGTGKDMVDQRIGKYVAINSLKYYFSVDTIYVLKKLGLLIFPFTNKDWYLKYRDNEPLLPRQDVNAPDLYIPLMAYVTYVLATGVIMGTSDRFSPEVLGVISSQALAWVLLELLIQSVTLYISSINAKLKMYDLLSFIGYKFLAVIICMLSGILFHKKGYYACLAYTSASFAFFTMRALKQHILYYPEDFQESSTSYAQSTQCSNGTKRRLYFLFFTGISQPILIWCLSYHVLSLLS